MVGRDPVPPRSFFGLGVVAGLRTGYTRGMRSRIVAALFIALPVWLFLTAALGSADYEWFTPDALVDTTQATQMCPDIYGYDIRCLSLNMPVLLAEERPDWEQAFEDCLETGEYTREICLSSVIVDGEF